MRGECTLDMRRLMFSVLERGIKDIVKYHHPDHAKNASPAAYRDSLSWVTSQGIYYKQEAHVFSYVNICDTLGLPCDAIREKILSILEGEDDISEQLLGGSLWRHGVASSTARGAPGYHIQESALLLLHTEQVIDDEETWHGFPERETVDTEDEPSQGEDDTSWD